MLTLLRSIENADTGVFGGYINEGEVRVLLDEDGEVIEPISSWEPIDKRGQPATWPKRPTKGRRPVRLTLTVMADVERRDIGSLADSMDGLAELEGYDVPKPCEWEMA